MNDIDSNYLKIIERLENTNDHFFVTGNAGTGKSTLLTHFRQSSKKNLAVTAPTGVAAVNVRGETIHSFFKFAPTITPHQAVVEAKNTRQGSLYRQLDTLIIDEISMVRADLLDSIDQFLKTVRRSDLPFGGVQLIMFGDLYQLPPVVTNLEKDLIESTYVSPFFFSSNAINSINDNLLTKLRMITLDKIHRQKDQKFIDILNRVRHGLSTDEDFMTLNRQLLSDGEYSEKHIILTSVNAQADQINQKRLAEVVGSLHQYHAQVSGLFSSTAYPVPDVIGLKTGARVMLVNNDPDDRWINGTLGIIYSLKPSEALVKLDNGEMVEVKPVTWSSFKNELDNDKKTFSVKEVGSYKQMPLKLAWAITIHKSQGQTFDDVIIDLGRGAFAHGQTYVALSRCTRLSGIKLLRPVSKQDIIFDERVKKFLSEYRAKDLN